MIDILIFIIVFIVFLPWIAQILGCNENTKKLNELESEFQDPIDY